MLLEIANDDAMTTGTAGTKLCLSYAADIMKQLTDPTVEDKEFAYWLIKSLVGTIKEGEDKTKLWKQFFTLCSSMEFCLRWRQYLEHLKLTGEPLVVNIVCDNNKKSVIVTCKRRGITNPSRQTKRRLIMISGLGRGINLILLQHSF